MAQNAVLLSRQQHDDSRSRLLDDWILAYKRGGDAQLSGAAQQRAMPVKLYASNCVDRDFDLSGEAMLIRFPRATFRGLEHQLEAMCAGKMEFSANALLLAYLESLWHCLPMLRDFEQHVVEAMTVQLVRACIMRTGEPRGSSINTASRGRLEAAKRYIDERLTSSSLTVESVQASLGISRRQLYSLFAAHGGVARYILTQRLRKCHSAISDRMDERPAARIAEQFGIDPAQLERLFRKEFGYDPETLRNKNMPVDGVHRAYEAERGVRAA